MKMLLVGVCALALGTSAYAEGEGAAAGDAGAQCSVEAKCKVECDGDCGKCTAAGKCTEGQPSGKCKCRKGNRKGMKGERCNCPGEGAGRRNRVKPATLQIGEKTTLAEIEAYKQEVAEKIDAAFAAYAAKEPGEDGVKQPTRLILMVNDRMMGCPGMGPGKGPKGQGAKKGRRHNKQHNSPEESAPENEEK